jgi:hypothetical protein
MFGSIVFSFLIDRSLEHPGEFGEKSVALLRLLALL